MRISEIIHEPVRDNLESYLRMIVNHDTQTPCLQQSTTVPRYKYFALVFTCSSSASAWYYCIICSKGHFLSPEENDFYNKTDQDVRQDQDHDRQEDQTTMMETIDKKVIKTVKTTVKYLIKRRRHQRSQHGDDCWWIRNRAPVEEDYKSCIYNDPERWKTPTEPRLRNRLL